MQGIPRRVTSFFKKPEKSEFRMERRAATFDQRKSVDSIHNNGSVTNLLALDPNRENAWSKGRNGVDIYVGKPKTKKTKVLNHDPRNMSAEQEAQFLARHPHIMPNTQVYQSTNKVLRLSNPDLRADGHPVRSSSLYNLKNYPAGSMDSLSGLSTPDLSTGVSSRTVSTAETAMSSTTDLRLPALDLSRINKKLKTFILPEDYHCDSPTAEIFEHYVEKRLSAIHEGVVYTPRLV